MGHTGIGSGDGGGVNDHKTIYNTNSHLNIFIERRQRYCYLVNIANNKKKGGKNKN